MVSLCLFIKSPYDIIKFIIEHVIYCYARYSNTFKIIS